MGSNDRRQALRLVGTFLVAIAVTVGICMWVIAVDARAGVSEALKTGGLAGTAVVALYGVWLNDRRRRVEEGRQLVEEERLRVDGTRISHERFARAIELLGNDADQVRVGAMHALVGLARGNPTYTQTVIDVLCSYLRRPFHHRAYEREGHDPDRHDFAELGRGPLSDEQSAEDRERQVRLTAHRMLKELLPPANGHEATYDLDLTGASLEYLNLEDRKIGGVLARRSTLYGLTRLARAEFGGQAMFTDAVFRGLTDLSGTRFAAGLSLQGARFDKPTTLSGAVFQEWADLRWQEPAEISLDGATAADGARVKLMPGWALQSDGLHTINSSSSRA